MDEKYVKLNSGFNNEVYFLPDKDKVLRISQKGKTKAMVKQELKWMNFLYENGVEVPHQEIGIESQEGMVETYFQYIEGEHIDVTKVSNWNETMFEQFGRILGRMHALSKEFHANVIYRPKWTVENPDVFGMRNSLSPKIRDRYNDLMSKLLPFEISKTTFGLIHNDFHQGNFIINKDGTLTIIDFDDCSYNWFAQDIAVLFYHAYWQNTSFNGSSNNFAQKFMNNVFKGYKTENFLHEDTVKQIPIFLKLREIYLHQLFTKAWDADNLEDWQGYTLKKLEENIMNQEPYVGIVDFSRYM